eukprot:6638370-Prymnesium_polylepis.1
MALKKLLAASVTAVLPALLSACVCQESCSYSRDADCDDGGPGAEFSICTLGTDCQDCGARGTCTAQPPAVYSPPPPPPPPHPPPPPSTIFVQSASTCTPGGSASTTFSTFSAPVGFKIASARLMIGMRGDLDGGNYEHARIWVNEADIGRICTTAALCGDGVCAFASCFVTASVLCDRCRVVPCSQCTRSALVGRRT